MWQRFTERARNAVLLAQEEAGKMQTHEVGPEHFLLALLRQAEAPAGQILQQRGLDYETIRQKIQSLSPNPELASQQDIRLTPEGKRILELAAHEAAQFQHDYVGTEHLLLALLALQSNAQILLREYGVETDSIRTYLVESASSVFQTKVQERILRGGDLASLVEAMQGHLTQPGQPANLVLEETVLGALKMQQESERKNGNQDRAAEIAGHITHLKLLKRQRDNGRDR